MFFLTLLCATVQAIRIESPISASVLTRGSPFHVFWTFKHSDPPEFVLGYSHIGGEIIVTDAKFKTHAGTAIIDGNLFPFTNAYKIYFFSTTGHKVLTESQKLQVY